MFAPSIRSNPFFPACKTLLGLCCMGVLASFTSPGQAAAAGSIQPVTAAARTLPVVSTQPQSLVVNAGKPATFSVVVSSSAAVTYQWLRNGVNIAGATASAYAIPAAAVADSGAAFTVTAKNTAGSVTSAVARLTVNAVISTQSATALRPFSDQSPWNARPSKFTLGSTEVPKSLYFPNISEGAFSLGVFTASASDAAMTVRGENGGGIWVPDAETALASVVVPHWPAGVLPAQGDDGHADIVDPVNNVIHSFWQLRVANGQWTATSYATSALDGRGFGTPAQYMQGARAAGVPSLAGLIRKHEVDDGAPAYRHALAMSLTFNALARTPAYVFPATGADYDASTTNSGTVPEGALMMIPAGFDVSTIKDPRLLKIVRTLQSFGAYVVDRNWGTPFVLYVENGSGFNLMPNGWDNEVAKELEIIRAALRQVVSTTEWVDANGVVFTPDTNLNLLSMRGYWAMQKGTNVGKFDTALQAVVFSNDGVPTVQVNSTGRSMPTVADQPVVGKSYTLKVVASGSATLKFELLSAGRAVYSSGALADGATVTFVWPAAGLKPQLTASSGPSGGGKVSATLVAAP